MYDRGASVTTAGNGHLPPADWYPDPAGTAQQRWWSGESWTEYFRDAPPTAAPVAPVTPSNFVSESYDPGAFTMGMTTETTWKPQTEAAPYQGMAGQLQFGGSSVRVDSAYSALQAGRTESSNTGFIWIVALYPLVNVIVTLVVYFTAVHENASTFSIRGAGVGLFVAAVFRDAATLRARTLPSASRWWMLLGPLGYVLARQHALRRGGVRGGAPTAGLVVAILGGSFLAGAAVLVYAFFPALGYGDDTALISEVEKVAEQELEQQTGGYWTVVCTPADGTSARSTPFPCSASSTDGRGLDLIATVNLDGTVDLAVG